jgi:hypothetical protein
MVLPVSIAVGGGGLALAFSAMARRGRDALLSAYLVVVLLVAAPLLVVALWPGAERWLGPLSPYAAVDALVESGDRAPILRSAGLWGLLGLAGVGWAAWRLRPDPSHEERTRPHRQRRSLPPVGERPVLWKELYVESRQSFHRFTRWAIGLLSIGLLAVSLTLAGIIAWTNWVRSDLSWAVWAEGLLTTWLGWSWLVSWLIQWAVGLRAAAAIAVERERDTWDAILTSPLEGREIFQGKVYGSVYALRGLLTAAIVSWTLGLVCGAFTLGEYGNLLGETLIVSAFMAALGAWASLSCASATRAMTWTMGGWLATRFAAMVLAGVLTAVGFLVGMMLLLYVEAVKGGASFGGAAPAISYLPIYRGVWLLLYALATLALSYYCRRRFDRLLAPVLEEARVLPAKQNTRTSTR